MSLILRYEGNPILSADDVPYKASLIFNAGVAKFNGRYVMAFRNDYGADKTNGRCEGTNMGLALSDDGVSWVAQSKPWIEWKTDEIHRAYDPRLTVIEGRCYLCFAIDTKHGIRGGIAVTDDFDKWEVLNLSAPDNRNMVLFPERLNGKFMRLERPFPVYGRGAKEAFDVWFSDSPDCRYWGNNQLVLGSEQVSWANAKIGPGAPPVRTKHGWLALIHAVTIDTTVELPAYHPGWHKTYTIGAMLLDLDEPWKVKGLCPEPVMAPTETYELEGYRGHVIFPGGLILEETGELKIYYGGADTVECLAFADAEELARACLR